jgi:DNA-binding response OmpR family regulator
MNKVLIIDDDEELCMLMAKCIEQENLSVVVANGGIEGLQILEENKDSCTLIILDIMMPDLDGFQVLQQIRRQVMFLSLC